LQHAGERNGSLLLAIASGNPRYRRNGATIRILTFGWATKVQHHVSQSCRSTDSRFLPMKSTWKFGFLPRRKTISHLLAAEIGHAAFNGLQTRTLCASKNTFRVEFARLQWRPLSPSGLFCSYFIDCSAGCTQEKRNLLISGNCTDSKLKRGIKTKVPSRTQKSRPNSPGVVFVMRLRRALEYICP
jgi:hypothetical protein